VTVELSEAQLERLADLIAERLRPDVPGERRGGALVDAAAVAEALGVSRQTIYSHAAELGGERVGTGPRARWRFDLEAARAAMASCSTSSVPGVAPASADGASEPPRARRRRRLPNGLPPAGAILSSRPQSGAPS
jgi:hypothetical protein